MASLWAAILNFLKTAIPWFAVLVAYYKGRRAAQDDVSKTNLEKKVKYAEIRADKSNSIDDDLGRMSEGTY